MADQNPERFVDGFDTLPPCWTCRHKHSGQPTCNAFPDGIPAEIRRGDNQHTEPYPGDNGIQYERKEDS